MGAGEQIALYIILLMKSKDSHSDYPPEAYTLLSNAEKHHFWFRGRNTIIRKIITSTYPDYSGKRILEVGCGTGYVLRELDHMGFRVTGIDMHPEGLVYAKKRVPNARLVRGDLFTYKPGKPFDAIGIFDVVEHIEQDIEALQHCARLLSHHGRLFLTVPAREELRSVYDDISGHKRRYTKEALSRVLEKAGFRICFIGYFGFFQYFPHLFMKRFTLQKRSDQIPDTLSVLRHVVWQPPAFLNWLLEKSFDLDMFISRFMSLPIGTSLIVSAEKS